MTEELVASIERVLNRVALGALAALNAHFYEAMHAPFVEAALQDPVGAYREALKVVPETMVRTIFRTMLRALGLDTPLVEAAVEGLSRGDPSRFLEALREAIKGRGLA